ncbi:MAG: hypothetical protein ACI9DK_000258 [Vicingaceae bacterium]
MENNSFGRFERIVWARKFEDIIFDKTQEFSSEKRQRINQMLFAVKDEGIINLVETILIIRFIEKRNKKITADLLL